jgi:hypothetical protein
LLRPELNEGSAKPPEEWGGCAPGWLRRTHSHGDYRSPPTSRQRQSRALIGQTKANRHARLGITCSVRLAVLSEPW